MSYRVNRNWQVVSYNPDTIRIRMVNTDKLCFEGVVNPICGIVKFYINYAYNIIYDISNVGINNKCTNAHMYV